MLLQILNIFMAVVIAFIPFILRYVRLTSKQIGKRNDFLICLPILKKIKFTNEFKVGGWAVSRYSGKLYHIYGRQFHKYYSFYMQTYPERYYQIKSCGELVAVNESQLIAVDMESIATVIKSTEDSYNGHMIEEFNKIVFEQLSHIYSSGIDDEVFRDYDIRYINDKCIYNRYVHRRYGFGRVSSVQKVKLRYNIINIL